MTKHTMPNQQDATIKEERAVLREQLLGEKASRALEFQTVAVRHFGAEGGIFLRQLLYRDGSGWDGDFWIYKSIPDWQDETGLGRKAQEKARKRLVGASAIEAEKRPAPDRRETWHFRVDPWKVMELLGDDLPNAKAGPDRDPVPLREQGTRIVKGTGTLPSRGSGFTEDYPEEHSEDSDFQSGADALDEEIFDDENDDDDKDEILARLDAMNDQERDVEATSSRPAVDPTQQEGQRGEAVNGTSPRRRDRSKVRKLLDSARYLLDQGRAWHAYDKVGEAMDLSLTNRSRRYRAVMAGSHDDDFHELSGLLFGAKERYRSVRATVRHFRRGGLATEAINRYVEYGFRHGVLHNLDPPYDEPRFREYEDLDEVSRLWHERPDRWRQETDPSDGSGTVYRVVDGRGPGWFFKPPDWADWFPTNRGEFSPDGELSGLLDPYELRHNELRYRILGTGTRTSGHGSTAHVRTTVEAEAEAVSWDYAPLEPFQDGADDYLLSVDAEVGVILRLASRLRGEEYDVFEVSDIAFDEEIPEGTFRLQLPGVRFRRVVR